MTPYSTCTRFHCSPWWPTGAVQWLPVLFYWQWLHHLHHLRHLRHLLPFTNNYCTCCWLVASSRASVAVSPQCPRSWRSWEQSWVVHTMCGAGICIWWARLPYRVHLFSYCRSFCDRSWTSPAVWIKWQPADFYRLLFSDPKNLTVKNGGHQIRCGAKQFLPNEKPKLEPIAKQINCSTPWQGKFYHYFSLPIHQPLTHTSIHTYIYKQNKEHHCWNGAS